MPRYIAKNTFRRGMNLDADITTQPQETYRDAYNIRITTDENNTMGIVENVKGNEQIITSTHLDNKYIVGTATLDDDLIVFAVDNTETYSYIFRFKFDNNSLDSTTDTYAEALIWTDYGYDEDDRLNLSISYPIKAVTRKEATDIEKIYWVDNYNYLRYANIAEYLTTDKLIKSASNDYVSAKTFGTVADILFVDPELQSIGGGGLNVGMVQYAYQLYNRNGSESAFSPATGLYHLTSSSENTTNSKDYKGNAQGEESGKSLTFSITLSDYEYDSIRVVSIFYDYYSQLPTINIITEKAIPDSGVVTYTDRGSGYLGSYTVEQFTSLAGLYKSRDIASSKNYLFLANVTENYFDIGEYDARVYRFRNYSGEIASILYDSDTSFYYKVLPDGSWEKKAYPSGSLITSGTNWSIPTNADCINRFNDNDYDGADYAQFEFKSNGATRGGTGKNIEYEFEYELITLDDNVNNYSIQTSARDSVVGFDNYSSPNNTANNRGFQRDETYRFGIVFFDKYGRESIVNWIGDIRIPSIEFAPVGFWSGSKTYAYMSKPKFTINLFPEGAVAYKIVRVERTDDDKSIVASGILRPTLRTKSGGNNRQPFHVFDGDSMDLGGTWFKWDLQEFISPEISFYKNLQVLGNDYIEVHDVDDIVLWDAYNHNTSITGDDDDHVQIKIRTSKFSSSSINLDVLAGKVVEPRLEDEVTPISDLSYYGFYKGDDDTDPKSGINGTSLLFKTTVTTDVLLMYGIPTNSKYTHDFVRYGIYRRNIQSSQYGGNTYSIRSNNEYIAASETSPITTDTVTCGYGDTFVAFHEHMALADGNPDGDGSFLNFMFPVESSINLQLRHDDRFSTVYRSGSRDYMNLREEGVADGTNDYSQMYLYNTVYSQENNLKKYFPLPENEEFEETKQFNTRIIVSERKFNGEESDSWLTFLSNNFIDVDANYGELTNILDYNNNLLFWQDRAFGMTDVDPRSLITDNNPGALTLGTGAVLSRFDYLSTLTGCTDDFNIVRSPRGIYWFDSINNIINKYDGKSIHRISKLLGVQSHLNTYKYSTCISTFDNIHDEVLFTLTNTDTAAEKTLVFNELVNGFTSFYSFIPVRYISVGNRVMTSEDNLSIYIHDTDTSEYAVYYGRAATDSTIKVPITDKPDIVKVFDNINYPSYVYNSNNVLQYDQTLSNIRYYNSYQNTGLTPLIPGTNIERKKGMWSMHIPRNAVNVDPSTNPDIFDEANLDTTQTFKPRMRDLYMVMDIEYDNTNDYRFNLPFIHTKYRANFR